MRPVPTMGQEVRYEPGERNTQRAGVSRGGRERRWLRSGGIMEAGLLIMALLLFGVSLVIVEEGIH